MENLDPKESFCHLSSAVGHKVVNALSTIVSQAEILRTLYGSSGEGRDEADQRNRLDRRGGTRLGGRDTTHDGL